MENGKWKGECQPQTACPGDWTDCLMGNAHKAGITVGIHQFQTLWMHTNVSQRSTHLTSETHTSLVFFYSADQEKFLKGFVQGFS